MSKRTNWKLAAATALLALCTRAAYAQAPDGPPQGGPPDGGPPPHGEMGRGQNPEREVRMLTRLLTLTPEQQTGVKAVLDQQAAQLNALRSKQEEGETPEARQANRAQAKELREQSNTKISALLNDSQKKTFADWIQRRKADMERRRGQEGPPPPDGGGPPPNE